MNGSACKNCINKNNVDIHAVHAAYERKIRSAQYTPTAYEEIERLLSKRRLIDHDFDKECQRIERKLRKGASVFAYFLDNCHAINKYTYTDIKNNRGVDLTTIVAIALVARFPLQETKFVLSLTSKNLDPHNHIHQAYETIIECRQSDNLPDDEVLEYYNQFLMEIEVKPLGYKE